MVDPGYGSELPVAAWSFSPVVDGRYRRDPVTTFRGGLTDALRAGHGLCRTLELELVSGPQLHVMARVFDPVSARWFARAVASAYDAHQWESVRIRPEIRLGIGDRWVAHRLRPWPEPMFPSNSGTALDTLAGALRSTPPGLRLRIHATPVPAPDLNWWSRGTPEDPRPMAAEAARPGFPRLDRSVTNSTATSAHRLFWRIRLELERTHGSAVEHAAIDAAHLLSSTSRTAGGNGLVFRPLHLRGRRLPVGGHTVVVSVDEYAALWPGKDCPVGVRTTPPLGREAVIALGRTNDGIVVGPTIEGHQGRHLAILGETGMGKSSLLIALARRVLREYGGVIFDPLGETVRSLRDALGPVERRRCLWIAPDSTDIGLNALEGAGGVDDPIRSERRLNDLVQALRRVRAGRYSESGFWGPRLEEMVTRALGAAAAFPEGTLRDGHTLLATSARLGRPVPPEAVEPVRELADRIRDRPEDADGARRLLHEVVRSPVLLRMLCNPNPSVRTRDLVAPGRIVLVCGDAAEVGESTARYLLSVLLALVWSELLSRPGSSKTFVILDEAQWFSHESLAEMLRLGRRKNVHAILATQSIRSLPEAIGEAVWTNVSDFVAFRGSPEEAREFSRAAPGVPAEALLSLPRGEAAVLVGKGASVQWVRTVRLPGLRAPAGSTNVPDPAPENPPRSKSAGSGVETVLEELLRAGAGLNVDAPIVVELSELRRRVDPAGGSVREVGSLLAREGALTRTERSTGERQWVIDRARLSALAARRGADALGENDSQRTQPS